MNTIKCIKLLKQAIVQVTVNTYAEQGQTGADEVFKLLEQVESEIKTGECGENQKTTEAPKKTNFDKITESVESLAKLLVEESKQYDRFNEVVYWGYGELGRTTDKNKAIKSTIKWLKQEAEDDDI